MAQHTVQRKPAPAAAVIADHRPVSQQKQKLVHGIGQSPLQRVATGGQGVIQMMRPHIEDVGRLFQIYRTGGRTVTIGEYLGPGRQRNTYRFRTNSYGEMEVHENDIIGYRPTVGSMHPPGQIRPPEQNVQGRDQVFLSEAGLSGVMAMQREDPSLLNRMVVTTYEEKPSYPEYEQNRRDLESQGVPILNSFDVSNREQSNRLNLMNSGGNIHFQMPRVTAGTKGYSTPKLVHDTLMMPQNMNRNDLSVTITTPHPSMYEGRKKRSATAIHNQFYGLESKRSLKDTDMKVIKKRRDKNMEKYGYEHRVNTRNKSAKVAEKRRKYYFVPKQSEHEDFKFFFNKKDDRDPPPTGGNSQMLQVN